LPQSSAAHGRTKTVTGRRGEVADSRAFRAWRYKSPTDIEPNHHNWRPIREIPEIRVYSLIQDVNPIEGIHMTSIIAYKISRPMAINTHTSDATRMSESLGVVCLWATAGLALTAIVFALGLGGEVGQFLANAG
jgi:hypothetical protein